jgi:hypothetical protein
MKRGLVVLDPKEIPPEELQSRITHLQRELRQQGISAALVYGDVYRSSDISYLSNLCIYWNEGVIAVPAQGEPVFLSKLSSRVHPWMRAISNLQDLRSGPDLAELARKYLAQMPQGVLGLMEMDWWPASLVQDLQDKLAGWQLRDLGPLVRTVRKHPSPAELRLLKGSAKISAEAAETGANAALSNPERAGVAEKLARMAGVEDVLVYCHPASAQIDTIEVFAEYRGYWTLAARLVAREVPAWLRAVHKAYQVCGRELRAGIDVAKLHQAAGTALAGERLKWRIDLIHHVDLETDGEYRSLTEQAAPVGVGSVVGMKLEVTFDDGSQAALADTFFITEKGAECLTGKMEA